VYLFYIVQNSYLFTARVAESAEMTRNERTESIHRRILCMSVIALLLLSLLGTGVAGAQAQQVQKGEARDDVAEEITPNEAMNLNLNLKVPIIIVYRGQGFALKADGTGLHTLRIHVVRIRHIEPMRVRELMEKDKSIEEIRGEIIEKGQTPSYRGHLRFAEEHYQLANLSVTHEGDNLTIKADVMVQVQEPLQGSELEPSKSVGNISVTVRDYESGMIGEGKLTMHGEEHWVLLDVLPAINK
jgi:hypothetical protein